MSDQRDPIQQCIEWLSFMVVNQEDRRMVQAELESIRGREYDRMLAWRDLDREANDICKACGGSGMLVYGSTSTWRGGIGGSAMTRGVCDKCWGSGDIAKPWTNLRNLPAPL